jgi:hypothetical protein
MPPDELERRLQKRLDALGPAPRAELLHVLMLPDFERADRIGEFWGYPESRAFAELLIDCEEDRVLRAVPRRDVARKEGQVGEQSQGSRHNEPVDAPDSPYVRDFARRMGANRRVGRRFAGYSELDADVAENRA